MTSSERLSCGWFNARISGRLAHPLCALVVPHRARNLCTDHARRAHRRGDLAGRGPCSRPRRGRFGTHFALETIAGPPSKKSDPEHLAQQQEASRQLDAALAADSRRPKGGSFFYENLRGCQFRKSPRRRAPKSSPPKAACATPWRALRAALAPAGLAPDKAAVRSHPRELSPRALRTSPSRGPACQRQQAEDVQLIDAVCRSRARGCVKSRARELSRKSRQNSSQRSSALRHGPFSQPPDDGSGNRGTGSVTSGPAFSRSAHLLPQQLDRRRGQPQRHVRPWPERSTPGWGQRASEAKDTVEDAAGVARRGCGGCGRHRAHRRRQPKHAIPQGNAGRPVGEAWAATSPQPPTVTSRLNDAEPRAKGFGNPRLGSHCKTATQRLAVPTGRYT